MTNVIKRENNLKQTQYSVSGLEWGTPYYIYVRSVCDREADDGVSLWSSPTEFTTKVPNPMPLPYKEEFDRWGSSSTNGYKLPAQGLENGWQKVSAGNYPYLTTTNYSSPASLYLYNFQGATTALSSRCGYAIAPLLATQDLTDVKVSFFGRAVTAATTAEQAASCYVDTLYIGAMTDPKDSTTFTLLKEVSVPTTTFKEYNVVLDNWAPSYGNYIAFTTAHAWSPRATNPTTGATGTIYNSLYIDDVIFSIYTDSKPLSLETTDVQGDNVSVSWSGRASDGWTIVVATKEINPDTVSATTSGVVLKDTAIASTVFDYKIENLTPQTWYYIYLKPTKGKEWSSISAMTLCLPLTPTKSFMMDFEYLGDSAATAQTKYVPDCWTAYNESNTTTASYIPGIYRYSTTASITATSYCRPGGRKSMHVYTYIPATATATSAGPAVFATPEIKVNDMASLYVSFWYKAQSNTYTFGLGVMKDPDDFSTYTELAVIYPGNTNWNQYEYVLGDLGYKPEMGKYVAWVADLHLDKSTARYAGGYIDDIQMYEQTCKAPQVNISQISDTSAIVMTGLPSSSVITYTLFKDTVVDALVLNDPDSGSVYMQKMVAAGKVAQADTLANGAGQILHDLEESTDYTIALQMLCDEGATSVYVLNTFTTQCAAKPLSYFEKIDFERITIDGKEVNIYNDTTYNSTTATWAGGARPIECWMLGNKAMDPSNKTAGFVPYVVRRTATQTNTTIVPSDWNALRLYSTTTYNGAYAIMPTLDVDDIRNYQVSFKGRANGGTALTKSALTTYAGGIIVGIVSDASDLSTFMALDTLYVQDTAVHKMVVRFDKYKGDADGNMGRQIAFMSEFAKTNVFVIDDITVSEASSGCQIPLHLRANPNVYDAELSWESSADSFYVYIANEVVAYDKWDTYAKWLAVKKTDKESVFVDGLQGSKPYYAYIKAVCQDTAQWALDPLYFKTECPESLMLPYEENFDSYATGGTSHPDCWDVYYNNYNLIDNPTSTIYPYVYSTAHYGTSGNGMYFYYYGTYNTPERRATAATPRIGGKINQTMVSFVYRNSSTTAISSSSDYTGYLIVGFASETSTLDTLLKTFVPIDTIAVKPYNGADAVWHEYVRELSDVSGENMHLVLATYNPWGTSTTYHAGQGGSIYLDNLKVEKIPTCFTPSVESVSNVTFETCDVSVSPAKEKDTKWDLMIVSGDEKDTVMVTDTLTVIPVKGLKNGTTYTVYARTNCGDGDVSAWSAGLDFNTQKLITDSAFYGFENTERTTLIPTSTSDSYVIHPDLSVQNISKAGTYATSYSYIPYNYSNSATITYSRTGEAALRMYNCFSTTATSCWTNAYVKLPQIENAQNKQLSFDMRAGYAGGDTILETNQYYRMAELEIGMIDADATDVSSYETLASFKMSPLYLHEKAINANNRLFDHIVFPLPEKLTVNKKLVLRNIGTEATSYIYLDNLTIEPKKQNVATPKFKSSAVSATTLTLNWDKNGAEKWNVYVVDADAAINFPLDSVAASDIVADKKDVTDTTVTFSGLTPGKKYYAYLQLAGESGIGATSIRRPEIMPLSEKIAVTDTIDFESGLVSLFGPTAAAADSAYLTLPGWYMGNKRYNGRAYQGDVHTYGTYYSGNTRSTTYQYMRYSHNKNTSADKDKNALRLYNGTTTGYNGAYAVMPMIDCDQLDTLQLNFWARPFWGTSVETAPKVGAATSTAPQRPLIVGTVTDPNDISTFEEIQRFTYSDLSLTTSTNLFENEDLWYDEFAISLAGTEGKYIAFLNDTIGYWFIDDISFGPATCFTPAGLKSSDVTNKSAVLSWKTFVDSKSRIQVATSGTYASNAIAIDTLVAEGVNSITVSGLEGSTRYVWHVRSECGGELGNSKWTSDGEFDTGCPAVGSGTKYSFEAAEGLVIRKGATSATYSIPNCWRADGTYTTKSSTYIPYVVSSSGTTWYSHASDALSGTETNLNGMYFYNSQSYLGTSTYYRSWAVTPEISGDIQDMQVSFYMLPNSYNPQTQLLAGAATTANYTSVVVVGLLSDPDDMSTFIPVDTLVYDRVNPTQSTPATPENDYMWQKMTVNFENVKETDAHFICFVGDANIAMEVCAEKLASYLETTSSWYVYNRFYIDDISIETKSECIIPSNVKASNILKDAAMITWESEGKADIVAVYTSAQLTESTLVVRDTVANDTLEIFDLEPFTNYYVTVQAICAEDMESDPSQTYEFHTLRVPKVAETFMTNIRIPADWESGTGRAEDVFAGTADIVPATTYAWYHGTALDGLVYPHQYMYMYSTTTLPTDATLDSAYLGSTYQKFGWMITPSVVLDDEHDAWLTFTGFMSGYGSVDGSPSSSTTIYRKADLNGKDDQFMVIVSDDNGETWKRENAIIWNNETGEDNGIRVDGKDRNHWYGKGDYSLSDLAVTKDEAVANPIRVDLSKYKGKTIKVAFYVENTLHNARNYMRISHLNLNYYVVEQGTLTNCQYEEFDESQTLGFAIDEDRIASGAQHFERIVYAPALDADLSEYTGSFLDSLYVLDAEVLSAPTYVINATICEGEEYSDNNFIPRMESGTYKQKGVCTETGCDSITVLNLTVIPRQYTVVEDTICEGQAYQFNGKEYLTRTITSDTLTSVVTGCDSIVTLFLEVVPALKDERTVQICSSNTYYMSEKYPALDQSGHYVDTIKNVDGCNVVIDLNLTVYDTLYSSYEVTTCAGTPVIYEGQTFTEAGVYPVYLKSAAGCDSLVTLTVNVTPVYLDTLNIQICNGETYPFNGLDISVAGEYKETVSSINGCDSTTVLVLDVLEKQEHYVDTVINESDLPYFYGDVTYPIGTEPGVYEDTITDAGVCGGVLYHKLTIISETGIDNLKAKDLRLTPSVINRDETVAVSSKFTSSELKGMRIDVYDMTGKQVMTTTEVGNPIEIDCFHVSGLYNVRITTGTQQVYIGRVVVR
ncbi:MAG: fibronectin type III domain-containing protein [Paludibacteraceae bacterium]|nr:fibronectin type III domain-containing protein [Paludibacteraceae bacterium]